MTESPEVRIDQLTGHRVLLAPGRGSRPDDFSGAARPEPAGAEGCPFCEGREDQSPPEVFAIRPGGSAPDAPGWRTRVVPNLYPALGAANGDVPSEGGAADALEGSPRGRQPGLFASREVRGAHEVLVHGPQHVTSLADLDAEQFGLAIETWRLRMRAHSGAAYRHLIVNEGPAAGASREHTHAQLYALPFVPPAVARERERFTAYFEQTQGGDLLTDLAAEEVRLGERLVAIDDEALLLAPWASRSPFELRVLPRRPAPRFEEDEAGTHMLRVAFSLLGERFSGPPQLNLWVRSAPTGAERFVWHVDIAPRLSIKAGFELGTGIDINVYAPERAAADLRSGAKPGELAASYA